jgi:hypothetical protein
MMFLRILFILFALFSTSAVAIEGRWRGEGFSQTHRSERPCSEIYFEFSVTKDFVTLVQGGYICGILQAEYPFSQFERGSNQTLLFQGEVVGFYDGRTLRLERPEDFFQAEFVLSEQGLMYKELWDDGRSLLLIEGVLDFHL